jgi:hypothetical protein
MFNILVVLTIKAYYFIQHNLYDEDGWRFLEVEGEYDDGCCFL